MSLTLGQNTKQFPSHRGDDVKKILFEQLHRDELASSGKFKEQQDPSQWDSQDRSADDVIS